MTSASNALGATVGVPALRACAQSSAAFRIASIESIAASKIRLYFSVSNSSNSKLLVCHFTSSPEPLCYLRMVLRVDFDVVVGEVAGVDGSAGIPRTEVYTDF